VGDVDTLRLRPLRLDDEGAARAAQRELAADRFTFALGYVVDDGWPAYLARLEDERNGVGLAPGRVPSSFLVAEAGGEIVGRSSIRHALNEQLLRIGGHVGFCVRPGHRRRGYATEILKQSLVIVWALGVERALVTCDDDNAGSAAAIERCGGIFESLYKPLLGAPVRRYWID
jgi:predicted acetyltransferase